MIKAKHRKWADLVFHAYIQGLMKRHFYALHLAGPIPRFDSDKSLLLLPNHSSWWDGFALYILNKQILKRRIYLMMLEEELMKNRFFSLVGAYSIHQQTIHGIRTSLQYTLDRLHDTREHPVVCFFPQGALLPFHQRPLGFKRGVEKILSRLQQPVNLCMLGIRLEYKSEQRAEIIMQFSENRIVSPGEVPDTRDLEENCRQTLDSLEKAVVSGQTGKVLIQGRPSINRTLEKTRKGRLSWN
jgi:1-acyl-sn-glycerol-3-phosphate acyltransferase